MQLTHSFVVPAYGDSPFLEECIESLLDQSLKSPIIITTSTPSDYIQHIAQKYKLEYRINPIGNVNIANDWNFAFAQVHTPFVTLAHQDERYHPDYTAMIFRRLNQLNSKNVSIIFTDYWELIENTSQNRPSIHATIKKLMLFPFLLKSNISSKIVKRALLIFGTPICCSSVTFHKAFLDDFEFSDRCKVALDWHTWLSLSKQDGQFLYINKKLIHHRIHLGSETYRQIQSGIRYNEELDIFTSIWGRIKAHFIMKFYALGHNFNVKVK